MHPGAWSKVTIRMVGPSPQDLGLEQDKFEEVSECVMGPFQTLTLHLFSASQFDPHNSQRLARRLQPQQALSNLVRSSLYLQERGPKHSNQFASYSPHQ